MTLTEYKRLIEAFLTHEISAAEFEERYMAAFLAEPGGMDKELFLILDALFAAVDCYWPGCAPGEETPFEISEEQLRREARDALARLEQLAARQAPPPQSED
ncbi:MULTISPECIES: colicin immunity domain-containing protein [Chloroflexus]|jgi:hypothetical protein|uniref:Colicin D immunity protein domain-containing protein n=1 Tax=Chloroflexus aurantiacus (strain ATCC 29366 / DSM 635 / J-10-fl) TaxID=324602 RepID=A9WIB5_CHLAA|nr:MULTISPECIES: colicin immunity domain-containing protein [Chloroflexus]ABY36407.1 hypothetical protein Caur_3216 [Chloroflexus aurantiacus J-10-fl]